MVTREEVKASVEYKWLGRQWKIYLGIFAFAMVIVAPIGLLKTNSLENIGVAFGILAVIYSLILGPFVLYFAWRQWELVHRCENYEKHQVRLEHPATSRWYRGAVLYRIQFRDNAGFMVNLDTRPLFHDGEFSVCSLSEYNNQMVEIFYDSEKERVILSRRV